MARTGNDEDRISQVGVQGPLPPPCVRLEVPAIQHVKEADAETRSAWLERLFDAHGEDRIPYIEIHRLAERELDRAARRCEAESPGLGTQFLDDVRLCMDSVHRFPLAGPEITAGVRGRLSRRFPFGVLYSIRPETMRVLALAAAFR